MDGSKAQNLHLQVEPVQHILLTIHKLEMLIFLPLLKPDDSLFILAFYQTDSFAFSLVNRHSCHILAKLST